jgi:fucokinase
LRILLLHSGGDSKRIPQYSACGKLFSPVARVIGATQRDTLFDEFIALSATIPERISDGMAVVAGDVLLLFDPSRISFSGGGAVAAASKVSVEIGVEHGVFLANDRDEIIEFLHKRPAEVLRAKGAVSKCGTVDLDIGLIWLSGAVVDDLWRTVSVDGRLSPSKYDFFVNDQVRLSFYADFLYPLASQATLAQYLKETPEFQFSEELLECRRQIWQLLHQHRMVIRRLAPAKYVHFGTTTELRALMTDELSAFGCFGWQRSVVSNVPTNSCFTAISSLVKNGAVVGDGTYLEDTRLAVECQIGKRCVISNLDLQFPVTVPDDAAVHVLPVCGNKFCARVFHVDDNPKNNVLFGANLSELLGFYRVPIDAVIDTADRSLWSAKLYPLVETRREVADSINFLCRFANRTAEAGEISRWLDAPRNSLGFLNADTARILAWQTEIEDDIRVAAFVSDVGEASLEKAKRHLGSGQALVRQLSQINQIARTSPLFLRMRLYKAISILLAPGSILDG